MLHVFPEQASVETEDATRKTVFGIGDFEFDGLVDQPLQLLLKWCCPDFWILGFDPVDEINTEIQMNRLVAQDVLELFAHTRHAVLAMERKHHDEAAVKEDAFHNDVETHEILDEPLHANRGF